MTTRTRRKNIASLRGGAAASAVAPLAGSSASTLLMREADLGGHFKARMFPRLDRVKADDKEGKLWEVTIIEAGVSLNGFDYLPGPLEEAAPLFVGVPVYAYKFGKNPGDEEKNHHLPEAAKGREERGHVGNLVARIVEAWWDAKEQAIKGMMAVIDQPTREKLLSAREAGQLGEGVENPMMGLSIDAAGLKEGAKVTKIVRPESVDLVTKAAAGGSVDRLVASVEDNNLEKDTMDIKELEGAVAKVFQAEMAKLKEAQHPAGAPAAPAPAAPAAVGDPVSSLRKMLEGAEGDARKALATRVLAMFKEMGLVQASAQDDRFNRMSAGLKGLLESGKSPKEITAGLTELVESVVEEPRDEKAEKILALETKLRESAIAGVLGSFSLKDGRSFHDITTAASIADLTGLTVSEDYSEVTGLKESLEALAEAHPWMVKAAQTNEELAAAKLKEEADTATAAAAKGKPAPRGQSVRLIESDDGVNASPTMKMITSRLAAVIPYAREGGDSAITEMNGLLAQAKALQV